MDQTYNGKFFYEVVKGKQIVLNGPNDNIRFTPSEEYPFAEVIEGKIVRGFKANEIVVLDHQL